MYGVDILVYFDNGRTDHVLLELAGWIVELRNIDGPDVIVEKESLCSDKLCFAEANDKSPDGGGNGVRLAAHAAHAAPALAAAVGAADNGSLDTWQLWDGAGLIKSLQDKKWLDLP